jgi:hypothetical protein
METVGIPAVYGKGERGCQDGRYFAIFKISSCPRYSQ